MRKLHLFEPDPNIFEVITIAMEQDGHHIQCLPDVHLPDFSNKILNYRPDLILIDVFELHPDSSVILNKLRLIPLDPRLIAISCDNDIEQKYKRLGFHDFVRKPFDLDCLSKTVTKGLTLKQMTHT